MIRKPIIKDDAHTQASIVGDSILDDARNAVDRLEAYNPAMTSLLDTVTQSHEATLRQMQETVDHYKREINQEKERHANALAQLQEQLNDAAAATAVIEAAIREANNQRSGWPSEQDPELHKASAAMEAVSKQIEEAKKGIGETDE